MKNPPVFPLPTLRGRRALITGTGGLALETALELAGAQAEVVIAGRNPMKYKAAAARIHAAYPEAEVRFESLDLSSLASVATLGGRLRAEGRPLDILINNAAVMALPRRETSADGFELQLATNYLGHFALTAQLLPLLQLAQRPRVVQLSSTAHKTGRLHLSDMQLTHNYTPWRAYAQSKLAMLMFAFELQRKSNEFGWRLMSTAAHPGYARTDLIANGPGTGSLAWRLGKLMGVFLSHSAADGAQATLLAATSAAAKPGGYYGPTGALELIGAAGKAKVSRRAQDQEAASLLWDLSCKLTGAVWK